MNTPTVKTEKADGKPELLKRFRIVETCVYEVDAANAEQAEEKFLAANPIERDAIFFVELDDREISEIEAEVEK